MQFMSKVSRPCVLETLSPGNFRLMVVFDIAQSRCCVDVIFSFFLLRVEVVCILRNIYIDGESNQAALWKRTWFGFFSVLWRMHGMIVFSSQPPAVWHRFCTECLLWYLSISLTWYWASYYSGILQLDGRNC